MSMMLTREEIFDLLRKMTDEPYNCERCGNKEPYLDGVPALMICPKCEGRRCGRHNESSICHCDNCD